MYRKSCYAAIWLWKLQIKHEEQKGQQRKDDLTKAGNLERGLCPLKQKLNAEKLEDKENMERQ